MFRSGKDAAPTSAKAGSYVPGVYTASLKLGTEQVNVEVTVDRDHINSITMVPLSEAVTTMYPLCSRLLTTWQDRSAILRLLTIFPIQRKLSIPLLPVKSY